MLTVDGLSAWYGAAQALREVSLQVAAGEVVTIVGRNGAGKTTLLRCLMGLHKQQRGTVTLAGTELSGLAAHKRARLGLGWVPDDRGTYATLSVEEHLTLPPKLGGDGWPLDQVYETFPMLQARRRSGGSQLSGGEQQILAIARALRSGARLLLCDEPTEGLAPVIIEQIGAALREVKERGGTVLLIEQNVRFASTIADRHYLLAQGRVVETLDSAQVRCREQELLTHLGI
ncbi:MAG TPA: ABC transporter ATP-binding protein [Mycobacteriales bacterium]|nr:ABC transporter ATP-binding protein [Mycobacteriales bacterium]